MSGDGARFREVARLQSGVAADEYGVLFRDLIAELDGIEARYLRVSARNLGTIPEWHPGRGEAAWIFIDEILVE